MPLEALNGQNPFKKRRKRSFSGFSASGFPPWAWALGAAPIDPVWIRCGCAVGVPKAVYACECKLYLVPFHCERSAEPHQKTHFFYNLGPFGVWGPIQRQGEPPGVRGINMSPWRGLTARSRQILFFGLWFQGLCQAESRPRKHEIGAA